MLKKPNDLQIIKGRPRKINKEGNVDKERQGRRQRKKRENIKR